MKIKQNLFKESFQYLKESKAYIFSIIFLFLASALISFLSPDKFKFLDAILAELISRTQNLSSIELTLFILQNNLQSAFYGLLFGIIFGIIPIIYSLSNGLVLGYVLALTIKANGLLTIWRLFPHGIFELPAVFISLGLGIKLGFSIFSKNKLKELKARFYKSFLAFLTIVIPLLIIAALIEGILIAIVK